MAVPRPATVEITFEFVCPILVEIVLTVVAKMFESVFVVVLTDERL